MISLRIVRTKVQENFTFAGPNIQQVFLDSILIHAWPGVMTKEPHHVILLQDL